MQGDFESSLPNCPPGKIPPPHFPERKKHRSPSLRKEEEEEEEGSWQFACLLLLLLSSFLPLRPCSFCTFGITRSIRAFGPNYPSPGYHYTVRRNSRARGGSSIYRFGRAQSKNGTRDDELS